MFFRDLKISKKLLLAFTVVILVSMVSNILVYRALTTISDGVDLNKVSYNLSLDVERMRLAAIDQQNSVRGYMATGDRAYIKRYEDQKAALVAASDHFKRVTVSDEQRKRVDLLLAAVQNWQNKSAEQQIALMQQPETREQALALTGKVTLGDARTIVDEMIASQNMLIDQRAVETDAADLMAQRTLIVGGIAAAVLAVLMGLTLSRSIAGPVMAMTEAMRRLATGDLKVEVPAIGRGDEIGSMATAVQTFKQAAVEQVRLEEEAVASRATSAAQRDRQIALDNSKAEDLRSFVYNVEQGFDALSDGDLTVRMQTPVAVEFEPIRAKFNDSVGKLEETIGSVVTAIGAIRVGLNEITTASADLSQRTEQQAASLEETVAALSEVTSGVNTTAASAANAQNTVATAQRNAEKGGLIVGQAIEAMNQIAQSSDKIGKIIGVIDEIAFQTNLLALNAGVEAARAGEAGRGFAVVAQEVRGLAQRSAEAAKEIKGLISTSSAQVEQGVSLVTASGRSLEDIVSQVGEMSVVVTDIARSAKEQAVSLREVSTAADQMDKVTQQNAAMVEETTAAAQSLTSETEELASMVERFRTSAGTSPQTAARSQGRPHMSPSRLRTVTRMRTGGTGALALVATSSDGEWTGF